MVKSNLISSYIKTECRNNHIARLNVISIALKNTLFYKKRGEEMITFQQSNLQD